MSLFHIATDSDIKSGVVSDVYFTRVSQALEWAGKNPHVVMEIRAQSFPSNWPWAVLGGVEEALRLLEGRNVDVVGMREGSVFGPEETVMSVAGHYLDFAVYETALLGLLCQATGVATKAARCRVAAGDRQVISFGARRMHPAITPMIERNAFIGGCDGVASIKSGELIHEKPLGTMAHALVLAMGDEREAFLAFDAATEPEVRRIALIDTFQDEKFGSLLAAETLGDKLAGVRLDTPGSRRGDFYKIMREVRWELDQRGFQHVGIFLSGGLDEWDILKYNEFASAYGIGTSISNAHVMDFAMDIVEVDGELRSKRGKMSGRKQVFRCHRCGSSQILPLGREPQPCDCREIPRPMLEELIAAGSIVTELLEPRDIRTGVLEQLVNYELETPPPR